MKNKQKPKAAKAAQLPIPDTTDASQIKEDKDPPVLDESENLSQEVLKERGISTPDYSHRSLARPAAPKEEEMSEEEANAMVEEAEAVEKAKVTKLEQDLDSKDWTLSDPVIPEELKFEIWIAVYRCPEGHKTKATNRQAKGGVKCWKCRETGKTVKAEIMPQFEDPPVTGDSDLDKRRRARKGSE